MSQVEISIYNQNQQLLKQFIPDESSSLVYYHEMFEGMRYFDMSEQLDNLQQSELNENEMTYTLRCSFQKFGEMMQETKTFKVTMKKVD